MPTVITQHTADGRTYTATPSLLEKLQRIVVDEQNAHAEKERAGRQLATDASTWPVLEKLGVALVERVAEFAESDLKDLVPGSPRQLERYAALDKILAERTFDFRNAVAFVVERQFRHDGHAVLTGDKAQAATAWMTTLQWSDPADQLTELVTVLESNDLRFLRTVAGAVKRVARELGQPELADVITQRLEVKERFAREEAEAIAQEAVLHFEYLVDRLGSRDPSVRQDMIDAARRRVEMEIKDDRGGEGPGSLLFNRARWFEVEEPEDKGPPAATPEQGDKLGHDLRTFLDRRYFGGES